MKKYSYNIKQFSFQELLRSAFDIYHLDRINESREIFKREEDQSTRYHKLFYELARTSKFNSMYEIFIEHIIKPIYNEQIVYQAIPTFRIAYLNNIAVGEFHKDKWYRNDKWAAFVKEDNFYLPFTDAFDTNTIWAETKEDKGDFQPLNCKYGEIIQWDGCNLTHGNKINETGKARISIDFRVIKHSNYKPSEHGSINMKTPFAIGGYYKTI